MMYESQHWGREGVTQGSLANQYGLFVQFQAGEIPNLKNRDCTFVITS